MDGICMTVMAVLVLHINSVASNEECLFSNIDVLKDECTYEGERILDIKETARNNTVCNLKRKVEWVLCADGVWIYQSGIIKWSGDVFQQQRRRRSFFGAIELFFKHLFGIRDDRPRDNVAPVMDCTPSVSVTAEPFQMYAKASWPTPTSIDTKDGTRRVKRVRGRPSGRHFPEGKTDVVYSSKDRSGNRMTCTVTVMVKVVRCRAPTPISNGYFQCFPHNDHVLGTWCKYGCYDGFELRPPEASVLTCKKGDRWSADNPKCEPWQCDPAPHVDDAHTVCTNGRYFRSICTYRCRTGFDMPPGVSRTIVCGINKRWRGYGVIQCTDIERPRFEYCPSMIIAGTDVGSNSTDISWSLPQVSDNSGDQIEPTLKTGYQPGSKLTAGIYKITYDAIDRGGNKAVECKFKVNVRDIRCPRLYPTPYVQFKCPNGYRTGTGCDVKCDPGKNIVGSDYVQCLPSKIGMYGEWQWKGGEKATCINTRQCSAIIPPINGAIACDNWLGGAFCQAQCRNGTDMASVDLKRLYVCNTEGSWVPSTSKLKKCRPVRRPKVYVGLSASCYFSGDCTDSNVQETIRNNFINVVKNSLFKMEVCPDSSECNAANVQVSCGAKDRRRRATEESSHVTLYITLPMDVGNETRYDEIQEQAANIQNASLEIAKDVLNKSFGDANITDINFSPFGLTLECKAGTVRSHHSIDCVECPEGSYYENGQQSCEPCKKGTYQDKTGKRTCIYCAQAKTTRDMGAVDISQCEDACPPGSYSLDGLYPCSPCEVGHFQQMYGQTRCHQCKGSRSTVTVGAVSFSQCQEFDIEFLFGKKSIVRTYLKKIDVVSEFTLSLWIKSIGNETSTGRLVFVLEDIIGEEKFSATFGPTMTNETSESHHFVLPDTRWHHIIMNFRNCTLFKYIDKMPLYAEKSICSIANVSGVVLKSDEDYSGSLGQINVWNTITLDAKPLKCHSLERGNILKWKEFEDATLDGNAVFNFPSECDDFDNCLSNPCINGECTDEFHGYTCECRTGFSGEQCETNIDDCDANICMNSASCIDDVASYSCQCANDFTGQFCEILMIHGGWTNWGNWSESTTTCGPGERTRTRSCTNPNPDNGGKFCDGLSSDEEICNNTQCQLCPSFRSSDNVIVDCTNMTETITCSLSCYEGYEFDIEPLETYYCGPDTFHEWNFETEENTRRQLPKCTKKHMAESLSVTYEASYKDLICDEKDMATTIKSEILSQLKTKTDLIPCTHKETCTVDVMKVSECDSETRSKRSNKEASFIITISTQPAQDNGTNTLPDIEDAFTKIIEYARDGDFTISIKGQTYEINLNASGMSGNLQCSPGMVRVDHFCVPCGRGAYVNGETCQFCDIGTYQDVEGQTYCISCPEGRTTDGVGALDISDCTVPVDVEVYAALKVGAIVGGCGAGVFAIVLLFFAYRRYKSKAKNSTAPTERFHMKSKPTTSAGGTLGPKKTIFLVGELNQHFH